MTRRILLVLLAFTAAIIVGAGLPLALNASAHDRSSFIQNAVGTVRTYAAVVQPRLDAIYPHGCKVGTQGPDIRVVTVIGEVRQARDGLLILTCDGDTLARQGMPKGDWGLLAEQAHRESLVANQAREQIPPEIDFTGSRIVVALAVYQHGGAGPLVGTVLLARSTAPLDRAIFALWVILGTIAATAMIGAAVLAFGLARWVSRPLKALDAAAGKLADGDLSSRAVVDSGPPELRRLGTRFNTMAGRLEALVHGSRAVIADVSHQLRTPLAALRLRLDLLASDTDPDTAHELAGALDELARLSRLVDGLLAVARAENVVPVPVAVDVAGVAAERVTAWHPVADDRGIVLEARADGRVLAWLGEGHLEQVLDNLLANALDALSPGQQVIVTTTATAAGPCLEVRDNGPGMSAQDRERAFLRFSTSNPNGTGLGLAIVHRLVTSNGGTASLAETPGGGLSVTLNFPAAARPGTVNGAPGSTSAPAAMGL
jgi:signal transduction histidine kinase